MVVFELLNLCCGIYLSLNLKNFKDDITKVLSSWMSITYIAFVIWAALSYFYAINQIEVLVNIIRHLTPFLCF